MKNILLILALGFFAHANAQRTLGISAGMTKAWENYGDVVTPEDAELHVFGKYVTLKAYKPLKKNFHFGTEPGLMQKGARCEPGFDQFNSDTYLYLNYVDLPIFIKYDRNVIKELISIDAKLGYGPSFLRKAYRGILPPNSLEDIKDITLSEVPLGKPFSETGSMNRFEHSLFSGISLGLNFGSSRIRFETDYIIGLSNVSRTITSKNRTIRWGIGYQYQL